MGIFDLFKSSPKVVGTFVSDADFKSNKARQKEMTPQTIGQLREIDIDEDRELKLEYFFYTNTSEKADGLANELKTLDYTVEHGLAAGAKDQFVVTGWTNKMKMTESVVSEWTSKMCDAGFKHDCEFDGWGTTPDQ